MIPALSSHSLLALMLTLRNRQVGFSSLLFYLVLVDSRFFYLPSLCSQALVCGGGEKIRMFESIFLLLIKTSITIEYIK
jgi:hypothetical protein